MSYSISTLLIRNLRDVFGENDPARRRAAIDDLYADDCIFYDPSKGAFRGRDEIDRIAGAIKATHPEFRYQPTTEPAESAMAGWSAGYQASRVRRQRTPGPISSLRRTAASPPFISFSTNYPDLDFSCPFSNFWFLLPSFCFRVPQVALFYLGLLVSCQAAVLRG